MLWEGIASLKYFQNWQFSFMNHLSVKLVPLLENLLPLPLFVFFSIEHSVHSVIWNQFFQKDMNSVTAVPSGRIFTAVTHTHHSPELTMLPSRPPFYLSRVTLPLSHSIPLSSWSLSSSSPPCLSWLCVRTLFLPVVSIETSCSLLFQATSYRLGLV